MSINAEKLKNMLVILWKYFGKERKTQCYLLIALTCLASFAEVVSIGIVVPFLSAFTAPDKLFNLPVLSTTLQFLNIDRPENLLLPITIFFILMVCVSCALRFLLMRSQMIICHKIGHDVSCEIYRRTLYQPYLIHVSRNTSDLVSGILGKVNGTVYNIVLPSMVMVSSAIMLLAIMTTLIFINPLIAFSALLGFGFIYTILIMYTKNKLALYSKAVSVEQNNTVRALHEGFGGIRDILLDRAQLVFCRAFEKADSKLRGAQSGIQVISSAPRFGIEALGMTLIAGLALVFSKTADDVSSTIPVLGAFALGAQRLLPILQQMYGSLSSIRGGQVSLEDTLKLLEQPLPTMPIEKEIKAILFTQNINLKGINFRYSPERGAVLHDLTLSIKRGECIGITGSSGSGKSTLLDVIMGLLEPTNGYMDVDGVVIDEQNRQNWQAQLAHVPQSIYLTDASIAENIAFGVPLGKIDFERLKLAAEKAQLIQTIETLPDKFFTKVGERGIQLSGGQRQRIGIARALYKKAKVIVFDEATSALDTITEKAVMQSIGSLRGELTIIMVTHRTSTLSVCSRIVELENGLIKQISANE